MTIQITDTGHQSLLQHNVSVSSTVINIVKQMFIVSLTILNSDNFINRFWAKFYCKRIVMIMVSI